MKLNNLLIGVLLAVPCAALSDQGDLPIKTSGPYAGVGGGFSKIDTRDGSISVGGESFGYRILGGYRFAHLPLPFNIDLGIEVAYADLGKVDEVAAGANVEVDMKSLITAGVVYVPISPRWDVFGKAGVYFWDGKVTADGIETSNESGSDLSFGLGIAMQTGSSFGAQLEIESVDALDGIWVATLSATYQFK
jgi:hypothetical protein